MKNLKQHPLSAAWPAMQADEYQSLRDSIEAIGVQNPITLFEGMVIDGWHRYTAANEVGMACPSKLLGDVDPVDFVKSQNDARRNVSASQRAAAIVTIYAWRPTSVKSGAINSGMNPVHPSGKTNEELANLAGTTIRTIQQAKTVEAKATPEVKAAVKAGTMSVKKAAETVKPKAAKKVTAPAAPVAQDDEGAPDADELASVAAQEEAAQKTMQFLLASDEPMADLAAKNTQLEAQLKQLNLRIAGLQNSNNEYIKTIKRLQAQIKKQEQAS